mgnify:CR=1 FL=1
MKHLFKSPLTSERHRKIGTCDKSDFAGLELIELDKEEKKLIVSFKDYSKEVEYIEYAKQVYTKVNDDYGFAGMSREEQAKWVKKQGKYSYKSAIELMLILRERKENTYSNVYGGSFILIGNTLYTLYCDKKDLAITVCGNLLFSCWLSIGIECHSGKRNIRLNKKNLEDTIRKERIRFNNAKSNNGGVDKHVSFSYPTSVKWGI